MSSPSNLFMASSTEYLGTFPTENGDKYKAKFSFKNKASDKVAANVGFLFLGPNDAKTFVHARGETEPSSQKENLSFTGDGNNAHFCFLLGTDLVNNPNGRVQANIGWDAAEEGHPMVALIWIEGVNDPPNVSATPGGTSIELVDGSGSSPYLVCLESLFPNFNNLRLRPFNDGEGWQESSYATLFDGEGKPYFTFMGNSGEDVIVPKAGAHLMAFLKTPDAEDVSDPGSSKKKKKYSFVVGDPRNDGTMEIDEV